MIHSSISKPLSVSKVRSTGYDGNLAKGELAVVKDAGVKGQGLTVVASYAGMSVNDRIQIKVGEVTTPNGLRVKEVPSKSTGWFKISDVIEVSAHVPSQTTLKTDWLEVGYDGINDNTALFIPEGKSAVLDFLLHGQVASMFFGRDEWLVSKEVYRPVGATMQEVIRKAVQELQEERVPTATGWDSTTDKLSQFLEIGVIDSSATPAVGTSQSLFTIDVNDNGDSNDLAVIQAQYPTRVVKILDRKEEVTTYGILAPAGTTLANATVTVISNVYKDCDVCPDGYDEADLEGYCTKETETTYTWNEGDSCVLTVKQFNITLPDTDCGASRLTELQTAFPDLTIEEGVATGNARRTVTLTGSSGNAVIAVNGTNYTTAYNTSLTQTATDFVTNHASDILANTGVVVTSSGAVITFNGASTGFPTIAGVAGGLTETVSALDYLTTAQAGGCKRTYSTFVTTNAVCEQCDDIYLQPFVANAPDDYQGISWSEVEPAFDENAKMGIFVKGKSFFMYPEIYEEDFVPFIETSLKVKSISFGASGSLLLNYTGEPYDPELEFAPSRHIRFAQDVNNDGISLFGAERMGNTHYTNKKVHTQNLFARTNLSQERILKYHKKYVQYAVKWKDTGLSQGGASRSDITHEARYFIEYGKHADLQTAINALATKAGVATVSI